ncbi:WbqC family protein [Candidatus Raskinella chloraquaticus]
MTKTVVVIQSNYIPWRGYFDMLRLADEVIFLESVQYTRQDWRNRNRIKTPNGLIWLTIPVEARFGQAIDETRPAQAGWVENHIASITHAYRRAAHFDRVAPWIFSAMREAGQAAILSQINAILLQKICSGLGIERMMHRCVDVIERSALAAMNPSERVVELVLARGGTRYLSGPAAQDYLDVPAFQRSGIEVAWMDYSGYPDYPQLWGAFEPAVSIVDLLLNVGEDAQRYLDRSS